MGAAVSSVAGLVADLAAGLLAGFSIVFVDLEPEALSSSEKLFFNHLDGKHMTGIEPAKEEREGKGEGVEVESTRKDGIREWDSILSMLCSFYIKGRALSARTIEKSGTNSMQRAW